MSGYQCHLRQVNSSQLPNPFLYDLRQVFSHITGEVLIFGSYLAHRSGPNNSPNGRASIYATFVSFFLNPVQISDYVVRSYNTAADGGDIHDDYYAHRTVLWPATAKRKPGEMYEEGAAHYGKNNDFHE